MLCAFCDLLQTQISIQNCTTKPSDSKSIRPVNSAPPKIFAVQRSYLAALAGPNWVAIKTVNLFL